MLILFSSLSGTRLNYRITLVILSNVLFIYCFKLAHCAYCGFVKLSFGLSKRDQDVRFYMTFEITKKHINCNVILFEKI